MIVNLYATKKSILVKKSFKNNKSVLFYEFSLQIRKRKQK